jgi:hypothetical protein
MVGITVTAPVVEVPEPPVPPAPKPPRESWWARLKRKIREWLNDA